jgi:hypothetical protein
MNTGAILVGIALVIVVAAYVARPLFAGQGNGRRGAADRANTRAQLTSRRDAIYALIRELDADHQTGKINDEDYQTLRQRYVAEGVVVLKQLDTMPSQDGRAALEAEIEAQVLTLRRSGTAPVDADRRSTTQFCTQCGYPVEPEDRFCARCGAPLKETASP